MNLMNCLIGRNEFGVYCVPKAAAHRPASRAVLAGKVYEPDTIAFLRGNAAGGDIIHAGTFFGDFLPALASVANHVWAFEPNPANHECALETINRNNLENVSLVHAAVSDEGGEVRLKVKGSFGRDLGGASHLVASSDTRATAVPAVRIDDTVPDSARVTVLHFDVEGHETPALTGAMETIRRCRPIIVLETDVSGDLKAALTALGYRRRGHVGVNTIRAVARPSVKPRKPSFLQRVERKMQPTVRRLLG
jgi:FkbM family methyltransferase